MLLPMFLTFAAPALAGEGPPPPVVDGLLYVQYGVDLSEGKNLTNSFDGSRAYLGVREDFNDHVAARILLDAGRGADNTKQWVFLKNAFIEWKDPFPGGEVQGGMINTPYNGYFDRFWGHRYAAKSFTDQYGLLSSADLGIGAQGTHAKGMVDWHAVVINGEGFAAPEVDATKTAQARVSIDPLAAGGKQNLVVTAFGSYGTAPPDTDPTKEGNQEGDSTLIYTGALGYRMDYFLAWLDYTGRSTGDLAASGYSAMIMPRVPKVGALYARYEHFDPDQEAGKDATDRILVGVSHDFYKRVSLALQYEHTMLEAVPDTPVLGISMRAQAGF